MKILAVCQYYDPEPFRITDICEELVRRGHEVTILTGVPNYPMGEIYPGYEKGQKRNEIKNGVKIIRCFTVPRKADTFHRLLNYFSYAISAWFKAGQIKENFDVVFTNQQSPVMMCWPAIRYAKKHQKKCIMYCMDLWPASLAAGGMNNGLIYKIFKWISKNIYRNVDVILNTSKLFETYQAQQFGVDKKRIRHLPQYAENLFDDVGSVDNGIVDLMFAGNMGAAQSLHTIIEAAAMLRDRQDILFHLVGDGSELENLQKKADEMELSNVVFHGRKPLSEMPEYYAMADAMLVTLTKDPLISMTLPGKVQTYMAAGKPILAAANGEIEFTLKDAQCGLCAAAEDAEGLAQIILAFVRSDSASQMGQNARAYYERMFSKVRFMDALEEKLRDASGKE